MRVTGQSTLSLYAVLNMCMCIAGGNVPKRQSGSLSKLAKAESMGDVLAAPLSGQSASSVKLLKGVGCRQYTSLNFKSCVAI